MDVDLSSKGQKPELEVSVNRGLAGSLGITVGQVAQSLRPAFAGIDAGDWQDPSGEMRNVQVRLAPESRRNAEDLLRKVKAAQYVASHPGEVCPAKWNEGSATLTPSFDLVGKI